MTNEKQPQLHRETLAAQGLGRVAEPYGEIVPPIHVSTTYERGGDGTYPGGRVYSRADNPTYDRGRGAHRAARARGGGDALRVGAGGRGGGVPGAAPGDRVLVPRNMYWAFRKWLLDFARRGGW